METSIKKLFVHHASDLQERICLALEAIDGKATFKKDAWLRPGGGGGLTRIIANGNVFEKAGVNTSAVEGVVTADMQKQLGMDASYFFATGISLVIHPINPFVPTVHANFRYFELYDAAHVLTDSWFGGGTDLTPYYLFKEDAVHFHQTLKQSCDTVDKLLYSSFKEKCDAYFVNTHRGNERRGIGGIFFDHLRAARDQPADYWLRFVQASSECFLPAYLPIVSRRMNDVFSEQQVYWQEIRRGRYVEFNLLHDRGTLFGIKTNGRTESILMSLPPRVRFDYQFQPLSGSEEDKLLQVCLQPANWV